MPVAAMDVHDLGELDRRQKSVTIHNGSRRHCNTLRPAGNHRPDFKVR